VNTIGGIWEVYASDFNNYQFVDRWIVDQKRSANPTIYLVKGYTYVFSIGSSDHPFWIKSTRSTDQLNGIPSGPGQALDYNGFDVGNMTFAIPLDYVPAHSPLYYVCEYHAQMQGEIYIVDTIAEAAAPIHTFSIFVVSLLVAFVFIF